MILYLYNSVIIYWVFSAISVFMCVLCLVVCFLSFHFLSYLPFQIDPVWVFVNIHLLLHDGIFLERGHIISIACHLTHYTEQEEYVFGNLTQYFLNIKHILVVDLRSHITKSLCSSLAIPANIYARLFTELSGRDHYVLANRISSVSFQILQKFTFYNCHNICFIEYIHDHASLFCKQDCRLSLDDLKFLAMIFNTQYM